MELNGKVFNVKTPEQHEKLKKRGATHPKSSGSAMLKNSIKKKAGY